MKKDDGALPKQWNWAEEVVKASLDPQNQWEFPNMDGRSAGIPGVRSQPMWEQPRQASKVPPRNAGHRSNDIVLKAQQRAAEVMRSEREHRMQHHDIFGTPAGGQVRGAFA